MQYEILVMFIKFHTPYIITHTSNIISDIQQHNININYKIIISDFVQIVTYL